MNPIRESILHMLQTSGETFLSGETISRRLGVTRAAVWKHIQALQAQGVEIEGVTRKGYRLRAHANILCAATVGPMLATKALGKEALFLPSAPSSNLIAKQLAAQGIAHGAIVVVEEQTAGRGRRGRAWKNAPGKDICISAVLRPRLAAQYAPRFTLATALGVYRLAAELGLAPSIKWPNDVLLAGKKICGILLEMEGSMEMIETIVVGFGLNVNNDVFPADIAGRATSLAQVAGKTFDRAAILSKLLNILEPYFEACENEEAFPALMAEYREKCGTLGQEIDVAGVQGTLHGVAEGVDEIGQLLLRTPDGQLRPVSAGDVTLSGAPFSPPVENE